MNYSVGVWGFDTDNDYYHDCDTIKAKIYRKRLVTLVMCAGWVGLLQD